MRFDYHTRYREGFALWRSAFDRNIYIFLALMLLALPWVATPFALGELAYLFILCIASLGLMTLTGMTGQVSLGHAAFCGHWRIWSRLVFVQRLAAATFIVTRSLDQCGSGTLGGHSCHSRLWLVPCHGHHGICHHH